MVTLRAMTAAATLPANSPAARFLLALSAILEDTRAVIAHDFYKHPVRGGIIVAVCTLLRAAHRRVGRILARLAAGKPPITRRFIQRKPLAAPRRPSLLPRANAWLLRDLGFRVAVHASRLESLLAQPGVAALIAQDPAIGRILRPVRRMLGSIPPKPRAPRPPKPRPRYGLPAHLWRPTIEHPVNDGKRPWWMLPERKFRKERALERALAKLGRAPPPTG